MSTMVVILVCIKSITSTVTYNLVLSSGHSAETVPPLISIVWYSPSVFYLPFSASLRILVISDCRGFQMLKKV